jgi:imidazoleglycerol-phosphate dehydratase
MTQRISEVVRNTNETKIRVRLNLDGTGQGTLNTGVPFLDHMIDQIKRHGLFDIDIHCDGDLEIDDHHTVEDCGITLGQAFAQALGDKKGLRRYGHFYAPLDEALSRVVVDLSGRPGLFMDIPFTRARIGTFDVDLFSEFFQGFVNHALMTLHIDNLKARIAITRSKVCLRHWLAHCVWHVKLIHVQKIPLLRPKVACNDTYCFT